MRSCGLYHHHYAEQREACREQLGGQPPRTVESMSAEEADEAKDEKWSLEEEYCPVCGCLLEVESIARAPPPPEMAKYLGPTS